MSATNLLLAEPRDFCFKWSHQDGSTVEFNPSGWASDDPLKADWLLKMNELCSSKPAICPIVRFWLREYCELIDFRCSERKEANGPRVRTHSSLPSLASARVAEIRNPQEVQRPAGSHQEISRFLKTPVRLSTWRSFCSQKVNYLQKSPLHAAKGTSEQPLVNDV
jgi:hypothetical protein